MSVISATTSGALKSLIEGGGLGLAAYRDELPKDVSLPAVQILEGISLVPSLSNSRYDRAGGTGSIETVQVSLWQRWRDADGRVTEDYSLPDALFSLLDGASLPTAPTHVWGVRCLNSVRLLERDQNLVQTALTLEVVRDF